MVTTDTLKNWYDQLLLINQLTKATNSLIFEFGEKNSYVLVNSDETPPYNANETIDISLKDIDLYSKKFSTVTILKKEEFPTQKIFSNKTLKEILFAPLFIDESFKWGGIIAYNYSDTSFSQESVKTLKTFQNSIKDSLILSLKQPKDLIHENTALNFLLDSLSGVPWRMCFKTFKFTFIGKQAPKVLGYSSEDWPTFNEWKASLHPDDQENAANFCYSQSLEGKDHSFEYRLIKKDGSMIWVRDVVSVKTNDNNKPIELVGFIIDITDIKEKENNLLKTNKLLNFERELFQTFIDTIPSFIFVKDMSGRLVIANKFYNTFFNKPNKNFIGQTVDEYFDKQISKELRTKEQYAIKHKKVVDHEILIPSTTGKKNWFFISYFPIFNEQKEVISIGGSSFNITERKNYEHKINTLNKQIEFILQGTDTILSMIDENNQVYYHSHKNILEPKEICFEKFRSKSKKCKECPGLKQTKEKTIFYYEDLSEDKKNYQVMVIPFKAENGHWHMAEIQVDISEKVAKDKEVAKLRDQLDIAMTAGKIAYLEIDIENQTCKSNAFLKQLTGFDLNESRPDIPWLSSRIHPEDYRRIQELSHNIMKDNLNEINFDFRFLNKSQKYIWLQFSGKVSEVDKSNNVCKITGILHDISAQKKLLNDLTLERNISLKASHAKTTFLSNMSHEIRTPMNAIIGFADLLGKHIQTPPLNNYINSIKTSGKMLLTLINDLLDVSKIEAGKMSLKNEPTNLMILLNEIEQTFTLTTQEKGIYLNIIKPKVFPEFVNIDNLRFKQVLLNLINNAIKFTHNGGVTVNYQFQPNHDNQKGTLTVSVNDTGIGIEKDKQKYIFDSFYQDEDLDKKKYQGTGLGLAIISKIVTMMGGKISLKSVLNEGSSFTLLIPNLAISGNVYNTAKNNTIDPILYEGNTVLIIDDIESNRYVLKAFAQNMNMKNLVASNGQEGIELALTYAPDIILLDIRMPIMDGFETLRKLRSYDRLKHIPAIAISASNLEKDVRKIYKNGFDGFISKPILETSLKHEFGKFLTGNNIQQEKEHTLSTTFNSFQKLTLIEKKEIHQILMEKVIPLWQQLLTIQPSDKLVNFSQLLKNICNKYKWLELEAYQNELNDSIHSFDFENIQKLMKTFTKLIDQSGT